MSDRKKQHIDLAFKSQIDKALKDPRFRYEPFTNFYRDELEPIKFVGKTLKAPVWISSMTGGTKIARKINRNLAQLAGEFGLGMGLGSCRSILDSNNNFDDFNMRQIIGSELPFFANIGINQVENLLNENKADRISELVYKLKADGIIIHINPLQEFFQPEGDMLTDTPENTIKKLTQNIDCKIIIKEVGQGMGYESLKSILHLPIDAIELAAFGGTNFTKLEMLRNNEKKHHFEQFINIGHTAEDMINDLNKLFVEFPQFSNKEIIISGGINDFLDGYYLINKSRFKAIYGQAYAFLQYAQNDYESLKSYFTTQLKGYKLANSFLRVV